MLFGIFEKFFKKEIETKCEVSAKPLTSKIEQLEKELFLKNLELEKVLKQYIELESTTSEDKRTENIQNKQVEIFEKNLREMKRDNDALRLQLADLESKSFDKLTLSTTPYKVSVDKLYSATKYKELIAELESKNIKFLNDIKVDDLPSDEAKKLYEDCQKGLCEFEIKLVGMKGERVAKVFNKYRKFTTYLAANYIEFMSELREFDFATLIDFGFKSEQIKEIKEITQDYFRDNVNS